MKRISVDSKCVSDKKGLQEVGKGNEFTFEPSIINKEIEEIAQDNTNDFLLNNILMGIQFFQSYERDVEILRKNWYKNVIMDSHHKSCFYADSIHKLVGNNVTFEPRHGPDKFNQELLHPLRIYITNTNIKAAYDPEVLNKLEIETVPHYFLLVKPCESDKKEKAGFVNLFEYKTKNIVTPYNSYSNPMRESYETNESNEYFERRSTISSYYRKPLDLRARRLTRIEKLIAFQNKETNGNTKNAQNGSKASSLTPEGIIPCNGYYKYIRPKERLNPQPIYEYKTNDVSQISHKIPKRCFQVVNVKNFNTRNAIVDTSADNCFTTKKVLNSAAFKANFCDVLIDKLSQDLNLNKYSLQSSVVHEEFIVISQPVVVNFVTSVIEIEDWSEHLKINTKSNRRSSHSIEWPTQHMEKIIHILPCVLVAKGYVEFTEENQDYEKEWKIEFPKAEEYLLLHMMHSHVRCYLFALIVYKSFIEKEINSASLGPKHLLHLLFWRVNKDFLGWPEDKPGETLINFFKILYKKLQNKFLRDFFIRSRNLFANSYVKDLHKAQTIIKLFLDNPVPYIMKAMKNLKIDDNFYCTFNYPALNTILTTYNKTISKPKKQNTKEKNESIKDREMKWRKSVIKQIQLERKIEEDLQYRESVDSINVEIIPKLQLKSSSGCQLLELFISHFIEMGLKSTEKEVLDQASMYLTQSKWLLNLLPLQEMNHEKRKELVKKVTEFEERYNKVLKLCSMHKNEKNFNNNCDELVLREEILEAKDDSGLSVISTNPNETKVKINTNDMASEFCDEYDTKL